MRAPSHLGQLHQVQALLDGGVAGALGLQPPRQALPQDAVLHVQGRVDWFDKGGGGGVRALIAGQAKSSMQRKKCTSVPDCDARTKRRGRQAFCSAANQGPSYTSCLALPHTALAAQPALDTIPTTTHCRAACSCTPGRPS